MKVKIKLSNNDKNIILPIGGSANLLGYDDNVQTIINGETNTSVNTASDLEVRRFDANYGSIFTVFAFWNGSSYVTQLAPLDFAANGLDKSSEQARNSFYVMQVFDDFNEATQTKLHTGYFNGYDFLNKSGGGLSTDYTINSNNTEFLSIYISNSFLEEKNSQTIDLYVKFLFYSAQSGKFYPFSKTSYTSITKQEDIYRKITINTSTFKYTINGSTFSAYEIYNPDYSTLINNTVSSIPVQKPVYPSGNTFTETGNYETI